MERAIKIMMVVFLVVSAIVVIAGFALLYTRLSNLPAASEIWASMPASLADDISQTVWSQAPSLNGLARTEDVDKVEAALDDFHDEWVKQPCVICEASTPVTPTVTVSLTVTPQPDVCIEEDIQFFPGDVKDVPKGYIVQGDVLVKSGEEWNVLFDDLEKTGLLTVMDEDGKIKAPYGADAARCLDLEEAIEAMKAAGCVSGCDRVVIVHWPSLATETRDK